MKISLYHPLMVSALLAMHACGGNKNEETTETAESTTTTFSTELVASEGNDGLMLPADFKVTIVADSTTSPARHMVVNTNGDIYLKVASNKVNGIIALRDSDQDGKADIREQFSTRSGTGIDIHDGYLYASSNTALYRYQLKEGELLPDTIGETIISGFPDQAQHEAKSFTFDSEGNVYVNVGAPSNACMEQARTAGSKGIDPCPQRDLQASIWKFKADQPGQTQKDDGYQYCTGIRNCVAVDWNHQTNSLYAVQHGRDQLSYLWPELFKDDQSAELPAEEFLQISADDDFGWPYCYYDPLQQAKVLAPEYGGNGKELGRCAEKKPPIMGFPAHMAPNDLLFYTGDLFPEHYKNGAFIAFHGSWNRTPLPQKGFFVAFVPFVNGKPSGEWEIFADGFSRLKKVANPGDAIHRPMGLAQGPDGSIYVSDSKKGKIWRIAYDG